MASPNVLADEDVRHADGVRKLDEVLDLQRER
jgi:hypothetical protein